jgi:DNA-binding LytR/AlgR family response regulator
MMLQAIAIDDEPIALEIIKSFATDVPFITLVACFTNAFSAAEYVRQNPVNLIFLDIRMPGLSGIEFLQTLSVKPIVIMTTAYSEYAVQGFELDVSDYLLKPFSFARFLKACTKAAHQFESASRKLQVNQPPAIFLKSSYEQIKVELKDILYVESVGNYMHFVLEEQTIVSRLTLLEVQALLPVNAFIRVHRSFLVAVNRITKIGKRNVWLGERSITIGDAYRSTVALLINR